MSDDDRSYYRRRAEEEIARAQASTNERAVSAHYHLAGFYLDRVYGEGGAQADPTPSKAEGVPARGGLRRESVRH